MIKKSIAVFAALLLVSNFSFANINVADACITYATNTVENEFAYYGGGSSDYEFFETVLYYYDACCESDGNIADPVFL